MQCPTCHAQVEGEPKFCPTCGSSLGLKGAGGSAAEASPPDAVDPFLGKTISGRYKITRLLGEGGMGAVYLGEQTIGGTARKVAIKTLHAHLSQDPKILARFERECETVVQLQHPNTIQLYDFGKTDDGILYMVMEFVQGRSLASVLEEKKALEPARVEYILQQICDALGEAHSLGIVHRDLKPDNIVLTERAKDWVKVLDFGIAKRGESGAKEEQKLTQQGTVLGTPPYMSPEQFTGKPIDSRSDIYSIGVMAYEMLAGHLPFDANTPWEWATQHMTVAPRPLTTGPTGGAIPERMRSAIMKALAKDAASRFATTRDFYEAFSGGVKLDVSAEAAPPTAQKGKTEIGTPLDLPAMGGYGGPGAVQGGAGSAPVPYTPAAGNVAFPTPAAIPQPPPRGGKGAGGKTGLVVGLLSVLGLAFAGVIVVGLMRGRSADTTPVDFSLDAGIASAAPPVTVESASPPAVVSAPDLDKTLPTLTAVRPPPPVRHVDSGASTPPPPAVDPKECQEARQMVATGADKKIPAVFASMKQACFAQRGHL